MLLVRDPAASLLSEYNRVSGGHTGHARTMDTWPQFAGEKEGRTYHLYPHLILNQTRVLDRFEVEDVTGGEVEESQC